VSAPLPSSRDSRAPLPEGTVPVGIGLFFAGIAAYAFFKVGQLALGKDDFKPIVTLWFTTFALVPGFLLPIEQEIGRALAHRRELGLGGRPVVRRVIPLAGALSMVLVVAMLIGAPAMTSHMFDGHASVTVALVSAVFTFGLLHVARGITSGSGRFPAYGTVLAVDGVVRIVSCIVLWLIGSRSIAAFAFAVVLSPIVAVIVVGARGQLRTDDGPEATFAEIAPNLVWLLIGSVMAALLVNAGPIGVDILAGTGEAAKVTAFGNGVLLARIPLFLFQAIQASLLPRLARLAAKGDLGEFRDGLFLLLKVVGGVAVLGTAGSALLGPWALGIMYDGGLDRRTLTLLALSSGLYMLAVAVAQAVIALHGHRWVAIGWVAGVSSFLALTTWASHDLYMRVEIGLVGGSAAALSVFAIGLRERFSSGVTPDADSMLDGIADTTIDL